MLDAEIGAAMLTDDELADAVAAQRTQLEKLQQEMARLAQDITDPKRQLKKSAK